MRVKSHKELARLGSPKPLKKFAAGVLYSESSRAAKGSVDFTKSRKLSEFTGFETLSTRNGSHPSQKRLKKLRKPNSTSKFPALEFKYLKKHLASPKGHYVTKEVIKSKPLAKRGESKDREIRTLTRVLNEYAHNLSYYKVSLNRLEALFQKLCRLIQEGQHAEAKAIAAEMAKHCNQTDEVSADSLDWKLTYLLERTKNVLAVLN